MIDFDVFISEPRRCGDLDTGTSDERVWLVCIACGA